MRFRSHLTAVAVTSVSALALSGLPIAYAQTGVEFTISNFTDFHGRWAKNESNNVPGAVALKCAIDKAGEGKPQAITSSGDNIGASPFESMLLNDAPTIGVLNAMGLDVTAVGNHEFDKGAADLTDRVAPGSDFPHLAANAEGLKKDGEKLKDYHIMELGGVKVAFIGAVTDDMPGLVSPAGIAGITWHDPVASINKIADELTEDGKADVVIALPHEGNIPATAWSENVDAVFMGHTHEYVKQSDSTPIVFQAGEYSKGLANIDFSYDKETDALTVQKAELLRAEQISQCDTPYPEIQKIIDDAMKTAGAAGQRVIGVLDEPIYRGANEGKEPGSNRGVESQLNNFIANSYRWGVAQRTSITPDIGIMNSGGVRADLLAGDVTLRNAQEVQPFDGDITYTTLKGADFIEALEQQWQAEGQRPFLALGVSDNVAYTYDPNKNRGERITQVLVDGTPLDPNADYIVAGPSFILGGGDNFTAFTKGTPLAALGVKDLEIFVDYLGSFLGEGDAPGPRSGQSNVGVSYEQPLVAGREATLHLTSLIYTMGETATTVTIELGGAKKTVDIDPDFGPDGYNEAGKATVTLAVPAEAVGNQNLRITTDAGTDISVPVTVHAPGAAESSSSGSAEHGSSQVGSSAFAAGSAVGSFATVAAIVGALFAAIGGLLTIQPQLLDLLRNNVPGFPL